MPQVVGVRLRYSKTLWFDPAGSEPVDNDIVIVRTERGQELGLVRHEICDIEESALVAELKPVVRVATEDDLRFSVELAEKEKSAMPVFRELIEKHGIQMKPVDIEYIFGGDKIIFYFSADERVDFRALVKDLAAYFHTRIDMRQVGVRDEARMVGGVGHCGEILCCARLGGEFAPVSIKMAKDQGLPLNPLKISGLCGRLMCCLRYEVDAYKDFTSRSPRKGALVDTPKGEAKVVGIDALREIITLQFQENESAGDRLAVPLEKMCCKKGSGCPCSVSKEALDEIEGTEDMSPDMLNMPEISFKDMIGTDSGGKSRGRGSSRRGADKTGGSGGQDRPARQKSAKPARNKGEAPETTSAGEGAPSVNEEGSSEKVTSRSKSRRRGRRRGGAKGEPGQVNAGDQSQGDAVNDGSSKQDGESAKQAGQRPNPRQPSRPASRPNPRPARTAEQGSGSSGTDTGGQSEGSDSARDGRVPRRRRR